MLSNPAISSSRLKGRFRLSSLVIKGSVSPWFGFVTLYGIEERERDLLSGVSLKTLISWRKTRKTTEFSSLEHNASVCRRPASGGMWGGGKRAACGRHTIGATTATYATLFLESLLLSLCLPYKEFLGSAYSFTHTVFRLEFVRYQWV